MELSREQMLERARARDAASDGRFITGVLSTGIYCLPSCPARNPKAANVRFFANGAAAKAEGLRPCLRCRPDDFEQGFDRDLETARELVARVRRDPGAYANLQELRAEEGGGATRFNEVVRRHLHRSPGRLLLEARLSAARVRLVSGNDRVADVAFEVGFETLSAFNDAFRRVDGIAPSALRSFAAGGPIAIDLPAGFRVADTIGFLGRHPTSPTERVDGRVVERALATPAGPTIARVELRAGRALLSCPLSADGPARLGIYLAVRRLLGLETDPAPFERTVSRRPDFSRLLVDALGTRIPQTATVFEALVWSLVGQQVTVSFAATLRSRLVEAWGTEIDGLRAHPEAIVIAALDPHDLTRFQFSRRKAEYLVDIARDAASGALDLEGLRSGTATEAESTLRDLRGVGPWSANYVMMRGCAFGDCVPVGDSGLATALERFFDLDHRPGPEEVRVLMAPFAPHRSLATTHLWRTLNTLPGGMA